MITDLTTFLSTLGTNPVMSSLDSEHDKNFLVRFTDRNPIVVKLMRIDRYRDSIDLIIECMKISKQIQMVSTSNVSIENHFCVAYEYIENGSLLSSFPSPLTLEQVTDIGKALGELDQTFSQCKLPQRSHYLEWNYLNFPKLIEDNLLFVGEKNREKIFKIFQFFSKKFLPRIPLLRHQICHNDCNYDNIIICNNGEGAEIKFIDFGDVDHVPTICDISILCTYLIGHYLRGRPNTSLQDIFSQIITPTVKGYISSFGPLSLEELNYIPLLTISRAAISILIQSRNMIASPRNSTYLGCSLDSNEQFLTIADCYGIEKLISHQISLD